MPAEEESPNGIWGQRHLRYIREHRKALYTGLFLDGKVNGYLAGLKNKIAELEQKLSSRDSIREQMERGRLKSENDSLRKENQKLRDVLAAHGIPFGRKQIDRDSR